MTSLDATASEPPLTLTEHDAGDVADLYTRCTDYFILQDGEPATLTDAIRLFRDVPEQKSEADQTILGWRAENGLVAVATILRDSPNDGVWYLGFMIVDAFARGQGIGRMIYGTIEQSMAKCGAHEIRLAVLEKNELAERFWRSFGYRELRRVGPDTFKLRNHHRVELCRPLGGDSTASFAR